MDKAKMGADLDATHGLVLSKRVALRLSPETGRQQAQKLVHEASMRAGTDGADLFEELAGPSPLEHQVLAQLADPESYLCSATVFVGRALETDRADLAEGPRSR